MLRILVFEEPYSVKLRLEGSLTVETAPQFTERWAEVRSRLQDRKLIVDLGDVVSMDEAGRDTLRWLVRSGARLGYAHPNVRPFVEELSCSETGSPAVAAAFWKRLHLGDCNQRWEASIHRLCRLICLLLPPALRPCGCRTS